MAKPSPSSPVASSAQTLFLGSLAVLLGAGLFARFVPLWRTSAMMPMHATQQDETLFASPSQIGSASFTGGDALRGLGAEWTYLLQEELSETDKAWMKGSVPVRRSEIGVAGKEERLVLLEGRIQDLAAFDAEVKKLEAMSVAGRGGYKIDLKDGRSSVLLVGSKTFLIVQAKDAKQLEAKTMSPETASYLATVQIP